MHAPSTVGTTSPSARRLAAELGTWSIGTLLGLLTVSAVVLCWRRLAGALSFPLAATGLLALALLVVAVALVIRTLPRHTLARPVAGELNRPVVWLPTLAILVIGGAVSVRGTSPTGLAVFWILVTLEEFWAWSALLRTAPSRLLSAGKLRIDPPQAPMPHPPLAGAAESTDDVIQQVVRTRAADGGETLAGFVRLGMVPRQRTATAHLAFCPPFARTPSLTVRQLGGPGGRIKTVQLLPYGARVDFKLGQPSEQPSTILLQFSAQSKPPTGPGEEILKG